MSSNEPNSSNKKMYCILCYIPFLWLVGMTQMPQDPDVKFHINQGIILTIAGVVIEIAASIFFFVPFLRSLLYIAGSIGWTVLAIMGIMNANNGEQKELPLIGKFQIYK